jgi:hypothetical protein
MKLLRQQDERLVFALNRAEQSLLVAVLQSFPAVPLSHHQLTKDAASDPAATANQRLLEESLQAQQGERLSWLTKMLAGTAYFKPVKNGFHLTVSRPEIEDLLQILNDVRVGNWLALGSPELEACASLSLNDNTAGHLHRMELAGWFEMFFLQSISRGA